MHWYSNDRGSRLCRLYVLWTDLVEKEEVKKGQCSPAIFVYKEHIPHAQDTKLTTSI